VNAEYLEELVAGGAVNGGAAVLGQACLQRAEDALAG